MKLSDLRDSSKHDDLEIFFTEDGDTKKKGKKKKDKDGKKKKGKNKNKSFDTSRDQYKESLKELGRNKLHDKLLELGIDTRKVDLESKKDMRRAILKKVYGDKPILSDDDDASPVDRVRSGKDLTTPKHSSSKDMKGYVPHFFDEDTGDFIITKAAKTSDMHCFEAMQALGAVRRSIRPEDGFGELMNRLTSKLSDAAAKGIESARPSDIVDVTDFTVMDDRASSKSREATELMASMSDDELKKLDQKLDAAIDNRRQKRK